VSLTNTAAEGEVTGYWSQNNFWFGGKEGMTWARPMTRGVDFTGQDAQGKQWFTYAWYYIDDARGGWNGAFHRGRPQGMVCLFDYDDLWRIYDNLEAVTTEWMYDKEIRSTKSETNPKSKLPMTQTRATCCASLAFQRPLKQERFLKPDAIVYKPNPEPRVLFLHGLWWEQFRTDAAIRAAFPKAEVCDGWLEESLVGLALSYFPGDYPSLLGYDLIVLANLPAAPLDIVGQEMFKDYAEAGGNLLLLGGDQAFGQARFTNEGLIKLLPVELGGPYNWRKLAGSRALKVSRCARHAGRRLRREGLGLLQPPVQAEAGRHGRRDRGRPRDPGAGRDTEGRPCRVCSRHALRQSRGGRDRVLGHPGLGNPHAEHRPLAGQTLTCIWPRVHTGHIAVGPRSLRLGVRVPPGAPYKQPKTLQPLATVGSWCFWC